MVVRMAAVAFGLLAAGSAMHGSRAELPGWLAGCWELRQGARHGLEMWMPPDGGMMLGASRVTVDGRVREYEQLRLELAGDTLVYTASPLGQTEAAFRSTEVSDRATSASPPVWISGATSAAAKITFMVTPFRLKRTRWPRSAKAH